MLARPRRTATMRADGASVECAIECPGHCPGNSSTHTGESSEARLHETRIEAELLTELLSEVVSRSARDARQRPARRCHVRGRAARRHWIERRWPHLRRAHTRYWWSASRVRTSM